MNCIPFKIIIVLYLFGILGCIKHNSGPCGDPGPTYQSKKYLGTVTIDSSFRTWINPTDTSLIFENSNGGRFYFSITKTIKGNSDEYLGYKKSVYPCAPDDEVHCYVGYDEVGYESSQVPFYIRLNRTIDINYEECLEYLDSTLKKSERIYFAVGNGRFNFLLSDTPSSYRSQILLLDSLYTNVYECSNTSTQVGLYPTKFFIQKGKGLIGFQLSDNEVWAIK